MGHFSCGPKIRDLNGNALNINYFQIIHMHATKLVTPGVLVALCVGLLAFIVIFRLIFRKKQ
jgi:hypothetical protein